MVSYTRMAKEDRGTPLGSRLGSLENFQSPDSKKNAAKPDEKKTALSVEQGSDAARETGRLNEIYKGCLTSAHEQLREMREILARGGDVSAYKTLRQKFEAEDLFKQATAHEDKSNPALQQLKKAWSERDAEIGAEITRYDDWSALYEQQATSSTYEEMLAMLMPLRNYLESSEAHKEARQSIVQFFLERIAFLQDKIDEIDRASAALTGPQRQQQIQQEDFQKRREELMAELDHVSAEKHKIDEEISGEVTEPANEEMPRIDTAAPDTVSVPESEKIVPREALSVEEAQPAAAAGRSVADEAAHNFPAVETADSGVEWKQSANGRLIGKNIEGLQKLARSLEEKNPGDAASPRDKRLYEEKVSKITRRLEGLKRIDAQGGQLTDAEAKPLRGVIDSKKNYARRLRVEYEQLTQAPSEAENAAQDLQRGKLPRPQDTKVSLQRRIAAADREIAALQAIYDAYRQSRQPRTDAPFSPEAAASQGSLAETGADALQSAHVSVESGGASPPADEAELSSAQAEASQTMAGFQSEDEEAVLRFEDEGGPFAREETSAEAALKATEAKEDTAKGEGLPENEKKETPLETVAFGAESLASRRHPERNEDAFLAMPEKGVFAIFDGTGGHAAGDIASSRARDMLAERIASLPDTHTVEDTQNALSLILQNISRSLYEEGLQDPKLQGMGTTASVVKIWRGPGGERKAIIANIGDSRAYRYATDGTLDAITLDDGHVREKFSDQAQAYAVQKKLANLTDFSALEGDERYCYENRNEMTQAVGRERVHPNVYAVDFKLGDKVILTSDGIHDNLTDDEIAWLVRDAADAGEASRVLAQAALARSRHPAHPRAKPDDMSAIVIEVAEKTTEGIPPTETEKEKLGTAVENVIEAGGKEAKRAKKAAEKEAKNAEKAAVVGDTTKLEKIKNAAEKMKEGGGAKALKEGKVWSWLKGFFAMAFLAIFGTFFTMAEKADKRKH